MLKTMLKKWWMILVQGLLLILLGIYLMNHPGELLVGLSFWLGILVLGTGVAGVAGYFASEKEEREMAALGWSLVTILLGVIMIGNMLVTTKVVTILFAFWMLATGVLLGNYGLQLKEDHHTFGWIILIVGVLSVILGIMMLFNMGMAAVGISTLLGLQTILAGLGFILLAFIKRFAGKKIKQKVASLKSGLQ
jgi:uncharacterized membrane protein HdeD (DUF308 family)